MSCNFGGQIVIVPSGCLDRKEIALQCKSPLEAVYYQFSLANRMQINDVIVSVVAQPTNDSLIIDDVCVLGQTFKVRISGGELNTKIGIRFIVTTQSGEIREFDVTLPVVPAGIMGNGNVGVYVIGNTGPTGPQGKQGPRGLQGVQGERGIQGIQGKIGTQILLHNYDPVQTDAGENIIWLNSDSGDLFESSFDDHGEYIWNKSGNLKGEVGSIVYSGTTDPLMSPLYKTGDLYLNITSNDLFSFQTEWVKISTLKGEQGNRGSLWFFGQEDPVASESFKEYDWFLNTKSYDLFNFNGSDWQNSGSLQGAQGIPGNDGRDGTYIITKDSDPEADSASSYENMLWINTQSWDIFQTIFNDESWKWIKIGSIKGEQGIQGIAGDNGQAGTVQIGDVSSGDHASVVNKGTDNKAVLDFILPKGEKGDAGSRWYVGQKSPTDKTGLEDPRGIPRPGDMYLYLNAENHDASTYILTDEYNWAGPMATVAGPQGPQGEQGIQGDKGDTGDTGGNGITPTLQAGTTTTLDAGQQANVTATTQGTNTTFDFEIPKGDKGDDGEKGVDGADGIQGEQGEKGDKGDKGDTGDKGDKGEPGIQGASYTNDGTVDLNVNTIHSDNNAVTTDGEGGLNVQSLLIGNPLLKSGLSIVDQQRLALKGYFLDIDGGAFMMISSSSINIYGNTLFYDELGFPGGKVDTKGNMQAKSLSLADINDANIIKTTGTQAWDSASKQPVWWDGAQWSGAVSTSKSSDSFTYIGCGYLLVGRANSYTQPAWVVVNEGALPPKTSTGSGLQYWDNSASIWTAPTDGVLQLDYNLAFNDSSGTGVDGTIFQEHDELWVCVCKKTDPVTWLPSSIIKHDLKPYSLQGSNNSTVYKPSGILNGSLSYPVTAGDQVQIKVVWFPKQLFASTVWSQRIQISEGRFSFYVS